MTASGVTLECSKCGLRWVVLANPDGTMPAAARCPKARGGCGTVRKIPARARQGAGDGPAGAPDAVEWDPPSEPRRARLTDEPCPHCGAPLIASRRGTLRVCNGYGKVAPAGVLAPYERGDSTGRQVKTQRETDLEALDLAGRKGVMLGELDTLADDDRLDSASRMKVEWFADQVRAARTGGRLDDLATLFADAGIRRRWWRRPAVITAGYADEDEYDDEYPDDDDEQDDGQDREPARLALVPPAPAAPPRPMTWAEAVAACGWRLSLTHGLCQVIDEFGKQCTADGNSPGIDIGNGRHAWLCGPHYGTLGSVIIEANRSRGVA